MKAPIRKLAMAIVASATCLGATAATQLTLNDGDTLTGVYEDYGITIAAGATAGVDMNGKVPEGARFRYIRLTDQGSHGSGSWPGRQMCRRRDNHPRARFREQRRCIRYVVCRHMHLCL